MNRLTIEIDPEQHRQIKTLASFSGMTLKDFILSRTLASLEEPVDATQQLLGAPENAKRLRKAIAAPASKHRVFDSMEDLKDALGI